MNRDEILNMSAGYEIDALVAEKVMGLDLDGKHPNLPARYVGTPPRYSTDIAAAWEVVEKIESLNLEDGYTFIQSGSFIPENMKWECEFRYQQLATASTAPLAICRAALLAVNSNDKS